MRSKRVIMLLAAISFCFVLASGAFADGWQDKASTDWYTDDGGTEASPYVISTAEQLAGIAKIIKDAPRSGAKTTFADKYFVLTNDIDLKGEEWLPIGWFMSNASNNGFAGTFDGQGHSIVGLKVTKISNASGSGFQTECPSLFGYLATKGTVKNLFVEGESSGNIAQGAAIAVTWNCGTIFNVAASGDVVAEGAGRAYGGVMTAVDNGGTVRNGVTYGTVLAKNDAVTKYAGNFCGYARQSAMTNYYDCVGLASSVQLAKADGTSPSLGSGMNSGMLKANATNCAWLSVLDTQPTSAGMSDATKITSEGEVKVTAVMLDRRSLSSEHYAKEDVVIPLAYYPIGGKSDDIIAEWMFDDKDVTVKGVDKGFATVNSKSLGTKNFTVLVRGINGISVTDSAVVLRGAITFSDESSDAPSDIAPEVEVAIGNVDADGGDIVSLRTENAPKDIAAVVGDSSKAFDHISQTIDGDGGASISKISDLQFVTTIAVEVAHDDADAAAARDLTITIKNFGFTIGEGKELIALIKENKAGAKYDLFTAKIENSVLTTVIKDFRKYFGGIDASSVRALASSAVNKIVFAEASIERSGVDSSSSGACSTGAAAALAAAFAIFRKKKQR